MGVQVWWPLALLVLVPVIILLYFLRQNVKKKEFSAIMLWKEVYRTTEATRPWEKLRNNLLLILQIITILLFIFALMGPWLSTMGSEKTLTVLVVDNSASMGTLYGDEQTRLEAAKDAACEYVDGLANGSTIYVISGNQQTVLEFSNSQDKAEAKKTIQDIEQTALAGDLSNSLGLVQSCVSQTEESQVVFFTDTVFDKGDLEARVENFYSEVENCSLDGVSYSVKENTLLVLVQATNYGGGELHREINLYGLDAQGKEELLEIKDVQIPAGETVSVYFEMDAEKVLPSSRALRAELNEADALAGDNEAWCVLEEEHTSQILLVTESNLFVEKAFENLPGTEIYRTSDLGVFETTEAAGYDLYIFDGMIPDVLPQNGNYMFLHCTAEELFQPSGSVDAARLSIVSSDVTNYTSDTSFGVNKSDVYDVPTWGTVFLQAGDQAAGFYGIYNGHRMAVLGFDLHETDFGLQAEFPILVSELSGYLLDSSLTEKTSYVAGESILIHGSSGGSDLDVVCPDGSTERIPAEESAGAYLEKQQPGVYQVSQQQGDTQKEQMFAVQFPSGSESMVDSAQSMVSEDGSAAGAGRVGAMELRNLFLIILLILIGAEWVVYVRRT